MTHIEPDPKTVSEIANAAFHRAVSKGRDLSVERAILALGVPDPITTGTFTAYRDAAVAEYDRLGAAVVRQEGDVRTVRAVVDAAGELPLEQFDSMPELREKLNALLEQFEDRIKAVDEAESLARVRAFKAKLDEQATVADRAVAIHVANLDRRYGHNDGSLD